MARDLADSLILPFNVSDYSDALRDLSDNLLDHFGPLMTENNVNTSNNMLTCSYFNQVT
jgi:hypothetical protein